MKPIFLLLCACLCGQIYAEDAISAEKQIQHTSHKASGMSDQARIEKARADEKARVERAKAARAAREADESTAPHRVEFIVKGWVSGIRLSVTPSIDNKRTIDISSVGEWSHAFEAHGGDVLTLVGRMPSVASETDFIIKIDGLEVAKATLHNSNERGGLTVLLNNDGTVTEQPVDTEIATTRTRSSRGSSTAESTTEAGPGSGRGKLIKAEYPEGWVGTRD